MLEPSLDEAMMNQILTQAWMLDVLATKMVVASLTVVVHPHQAAHLLVATVAVSHCGARQMLGMQKPLLVFCLKKHERSSFFVIE